jgi:hypothetical protein
MMNFISSLLLGSAAAFDAAALPLNEAETVFLRATVNGGAPFAVGDGQTSS